MVIWDYLVWNMLAVIVIVDVIAIVVVARWVKNKLDQLEAVAKSKSG